MGKTGPVPSVLVVLGDFGLVLGGIDPELGVKGRREVKVVEFINTPIVNGGLSFFRVIETWAHSSSIILTITKYMRIRFIAKATKEIIGTLTNISIRGGFGVIFSHRLLPLKVLTNQWRKNR